MKNDKRVVFEIVLGLFLGAILIYFLCNLPTNEKDSLVWIFHLLP
jgi:hypothetical protein